MSVRSFKVLLLAGLALFAIRVEAKPFPNTVINAENTNSFWEVLPPKGKVITCYISEGKRYPGKKSSVVINGVAGSLWKDDRVKLQKIAKKKGKKSPQYKKAKKKLKASKKLCKNSEIPSITPTPTPTPTPAPEPAIECGNGLIEGSEVCDDGNSIDGDGCSKLCGNEKCGDGTIQATLGEQCDDGNHTPNDGCSASCTIEGTKASPGTGFDGPTDEPDPVGNPLAAGYSAKVIAHWDTVPFQTFYDEFNVGVVAFHMNGISKVEFAVNGGNWVSVPTMSLNPQTGVQEYWIKLSASNFANDGLVEVRAIAYPSIGQPRLLEPLFLTKNSTDGLPNNVRYVSPSGNDTLGDGSITNPYLSIMKAAKALQIANGTGNADGGSIYLLPGSHNFGNYVADLETTTVNRWLTIRPAPGYSKDNVTLHTNASTVGIKTKLVRLEDLTIRTELKSDAALTDYLWISNCKLQGNGRDTVVGTDGFVSSSSGWTDYYITDSTILQHKNGLAAKIVRNVAISDIGSDAFSGAQLAVNSSVDGIDAEDTLFTPNLVEFDLSNGNIDNRIFYGITGLDAKAVGIYVNGQGTGSVNNVAFVNVLFDYIPGGTIEFSEWREVVSDHLLFWHMTTTQEFMWGTAANNLSNISIKNNSWQGFTAFGSADNDVLDDQAVDYNHFVNADMLNFTPGLNVSTGNPGYTDEANDDFTPTVSSVLKDRSTAVVVTVDLDNHLRANPVSLGCYE